MTPHARDPALSLRVRPLVRTTQLGGRGAPKPAIIHPAGDSVYQTLAGRLARALAARGIEAECTTDIALLPGRSTPLPASYRHRPLVVLGSLGTNRVLQPHYANFLCASDAGYPGAAGWELRTLVDPYHTGANLILAGGSDPAGVSCAVERLLRVIADATDTVIVPCLLEVSLGAELAARFAAWSLTPLTPAALQLPDSRGHFFRAAVIIATGNYTQMWWLTGDARYAEFAVKNLRALNAYVADSYGDWHYLAERFLRALPLLEGGGWLAEADRTRTAELLLGTALGTQNDWWRMRDGGPPLGHRHQGKGTAEFLLLAHYLRDQADPSPALRRCCDCWIGECQAFLDSLARAGIDDQDDESTFNNLAQLYRYALGEERHEFFTAGYARRVAERAVALHDNMGCGSGQGGYGEGHNMYLQHEATVQVACSAFYYGDGELKWILRHLPRLAESQRVTLFQFTPSFVHQFETGAELTPQIPHRLCGLTVLPVSGHQYALSTRPPHHVEPRGHMANAPETWLPAEGIGLTRLEPAQAFDKVMIRGGFAPTDAYLLLQGYQGGFRWQGHMQAANCIVRFAQAGHVWLVQNTLRHSPYDKNGLLISDGPGLDPLPPLAECVATADFAAAALSVTRLPSCAQADWTRHVFWSRQGAGWFAVIDRVTFISDGQHSVTCTWRTPAWAQLAGRRWQTEQGQHRFTLVAGSHVPATCEEETNQGATRPYVLRQRLAGPHRSGDEIAFQNLFYVRAQGDPEAFDLQRLDHHGAVVLRQGQPIAWCGTALTPDMAWLPGAAANAASAWITAECLVFAGVRELRLPGIALRSDSPVSLEINLAAGTLALPAGTAARVAVSTAGKTTTITGTGSLALAREVGCTLAVSVRSWLQATQPDLPTAPAAPVIAPDSLWRSSWTRPSGPDVPERLRNVCITATPPPTDDIAQQLIDTLLPQSREISELWPVAPHYDFTLRFPQPQAVATLNLLGDCVNEPTFRTFSPLPGNIRVEAETADGRRHPCPLVNAPDRLYKRIYVDFPALLQQQRATVARTVRALHVRCPAPAGGQPFVLHEIELLGQHRVAPAVKHWLASDLDADGDAEIILSDSSGNLLVLDATGHTRWECHLALEATHLSVQPAGAGGAPAVCVGLIDGTLHVFAAGGERILCIPLSAGLRHFDDVMLGVVQVVNSLTVWHRDETGRGWLVAGGYGLMYFLDGAGRVLGHSWADGAWVSSLLVPPPGHPAAGDLFARSGWNHGINCYAGRPGPEPCGAALTWGGSRQSMFRELQRVIPFVNGPSLAFSLVALPGRPAGALFAAAELGFGLFSLETRDWLWQHAIAGRLQCACTGQAAGRPAVMLGGADGFLNAFDLADGRVRRTYLAGAPVIALAPSAASGLLVVTRAGVQSLDADWRPQAVCVRPVRRALPLGSNRLLISRDDHSLELLHARE